MRVALLADVHLYCFIFLLFKHVMIPFCLFDRACNNQHSVAWHRDNLRTVPQCLHEPSEKTHRALLRRLANLRENLVVFILSMSKFLRG